MFVAVRVFFIVFQSQEKRKERNRGARESRSFIFFPAIRAIGCVVIIFITGGGAAVARTVLIEFLKENNSIARECSMRARQNVEFQTMEGKGYYSFPYWHVCLELLDEIRDSIENITAMRSRNEDRHGYVTDGHVTKQANR